MSLPVRGLVKTLQFNQRQAGQYDEHIYLSSPLHTGNSTLIVSDTDPEVCVIFQCHEILEGFLGLKQKGSQKCSSLQSCLESLDLWYLDL